MLYYPSTLCLFNNLCANLDINTLWLVIRSPEDIIKKKYIKSIKKKNIIKIPHNKWRLNKTYTIISQRSWWWQKWSHEKGKSMILSHISVLFQLSQSNMAATNTATWWFSMKTLSLITSYQTIYTTLFLFSFCISLYFTIYYIYRQSNII